MCRTPPGRTAIVLSAIILAAAIGGCAQQTPAAEAGGTYGSPAPSYGSPAPSYGAPAPRPAAPPPAAYSVPPPQAAAATLGPPPGGCDLNTGTNVNAAAAPLVGAAIGAAAGGGGLRSLFGAAIGAAAGSAVAAKLDADCHEYAVQYCLQLAAEQDQRLAAERAAADAREQQEEAAELAAEQQRQIALAQAHAAEVARLRAQRQAAARRTYKAMAWKTSNGTTGTIQPLSHETDPVTRTVCYSVSDALAEKGKEAGAGAARRYCRASDGSWKLAG
jgi:hypothetical protein